MPVEPSSSAQRVIELLRFLAANSEHSFTASDLARRLGQNRTTCHANLLALTSEDWVVRNPDRTYGLGPGLIQVGEAALSSVPRLDAVRTELQLLYDDLSLEVFAGVVAGSEMVVVARAGPEDTLGATMRLGRTYPLVPPFGLAFVAWNDSSMDSWLARAATPLSEEHVHGYRQAAEVARKLGYSMTLDPATRAELAGPIGEAMARLARNPRSQEARARRDRIMQSLTPDNYLLTDTDWSPKLPVSLISAPLEGPTGKIAGAISVVAYPRHITADNAVEIAARVRAAASRVSGQLSDRSGVGG